MRKLFEQGRLSMRQERALGAAMLVAGLVMMGAAVSRMSADNIVQAQVQQPEPPATSPSGDTKPAESMPGGTRPTTPAPEPARPQNNEPGLTGTTGAAPALPPAPAEKMAPRMDKK